MILISHLRKSNFRSDGSKSIFDIKRRKQFSDDLVFGNVQKFVRTTSISHESLDRLKVGSIIFVEDENCVYVKTNTEVLKMFPAESDLKRSYGELNHHNRSEFMGNIFANVKVLPDISNMFISTKD